MATRMVPNAVRPSIQLFQRRTAKLPVRLRLKRPTQHNTKYPIYRLPFVEKVDGRLRAWCFPAVAGYGPGCELGTAAAQAYLKAFKDCPSAGGWLQGLVLDVVDAGVGDQLDDGRKGIIVGFFSHLDRWLRLAVSFGGSHFETMEYAQLEYEMSQAASLTKEGYDQKLKAIIARLEANERAAEGGSKAASEVEAQS